MKQKKKNTVISSHFRFDTMWSTTTAATDDEKRKKSHRINNWTRCDATSNFSNFTFLYNWADVAAATAAAENRKAMQWAKTPQQAAVHHMLMQC